MKPIIILPIGAVSKEDLQRLNDNDLCVVEAQDPAAVKFVDPLPAATSRTEIENAAIQLSRRMLHTDKSWVDRKEISTLFVQLLTKGTPLQGGPTTAELEQEVFDRAKAEEIRVMAREEARAERAAKKTTKKEAPKS